MSLSPQSLTLLVPFPPGGSTDFTARILGDRLSTVSDRAVTVANLTGDFGFNAVRALMEGPEDRVFLVGNINANSIAPVVHRLQFSIDHWGVVQPVTRLAEFPSVVCTHPSFPAATLGDLLAHLKETKEIVRYGTDFLGTYVDIDVIGLSERAGLDRACMTSDGAIGILADLVAERTDLAILNVATATANAAKLKPLAIAGPNQLQNFPGVPTLKEEGFDEIGTSNWQGLLASGSTSQETVAELFAAVVEAVGDANTAQRFTDVDAMLVTSRSPEQFKQEIEAEAETWERFAPLIRNTRLLER